MAYKGTFKPNNPSKYVGNGEAITYRSSWELFVMRHFDSADSVLAWNSEGLAIPYFDKARSKWRRYFPDFLVKLRTRDGSIKTVLMEVKPEKEIRPPEGKGTRRKMLKEAATYVTNQCKWEAARAMCQSRGWEFRVMSEIGLGIKWR